ncbi:hypothetical protein HII36_44130 [Nonomuraea sp. NN258]|nr:hypothetical protein [Nonomuraea antri]
MPVLEVRPAVLDRRALGPWWSGPWWGGPWWGGPRYGVLLAPGAKVVDERRRRALNAPALALATAAGRAIVVGERAALDALLPDLDGVQVTPVIRTAPDGRPRRDGMGAHESVATGTVVAHKPVTGGAVVANEPVAGDAVVAYDPYVGYYAAVVPACGRSHVLWRHFHARPAGETIAVTALRVRRPVLLDVVPDGAGPLTTEPCPSHGTPIVTHRSTSTEGNHHDHD